MHVVIGLAIALLAAGVLVETGLASPFLGIPILALGAGFGAIFAVVARRMAERKLDTDVPSTREASYTPVIDPDERE